jgi:hypothetical protein
MGSNYCKNLYFEGCKLTRFDAHCGVYNATMKDCDVSLIRLIGGGNFTLDTVNFYFAQASAPIQLREDYGGTFNGDLIVKDCKIYTIQASIKGLISAPTANWDFGYGTYFPNVYIDNLQLMNAQTEFHILANEKDSYSSSNKFPYRSPLHDDVSNPDALFMVYYTTKNQNLPEEKPELVPFLKGFKKVEKAYTNLKNGEYTIVDNGDETYTIIAAGAKNVNPYYSPKVIEIKNMKDSKNAKGAAVTLKLYNCKFFDNTEIIETDRILKR